MGERQAVVGGILSGLYYGASEGTGRLHRDYGVECRSCSRSWVPFLESLPIVLLGILGFEELTCECASKGERIPELEEQHGATCYLRKVVQSLHPATLV